MARALLSDIRQGLPIARRDAVALARRVLDSPLVRSAEAILEAKDDELVAKVVELALLELTIDDDAAEQPVGT